MHITFCFSRCLRDFFAIHYLFTKQKQCACVAISMIHSDHNHLETPSAASVCRFLIILLRCKYKHYIANNQFRVLQSRVPPYNIMNFCYDVEAIIILFTSYNRHIIITLRLAPRCFQHLSSYCDGKIMS